MFVDDGCAEPLLQLAVDLHDFSSLERELLGHGCLVAVQRSCNVRLRLHNHACHACSERAHATTQAAATAAASTWSAAVRTTVVGSCRLSCNGGRGCSRWRSNR